MTARGEARARLIAQVDQILSDLRRRLETDLRCAFDDADCEDLADALALCDRQYGEARRDVIAQLDAILARIG
jgi:hypothetical protein